jgi:OFA family oxalate/formate antiporter-like MFS transporter
LPPAAAGCLGGESEEPCSREASPARAVDAAHAAPGGIFYGWVMVALTIVVLVASSPGQTYGFTYFNPCLREALGLSQTKLSAMYLLATLLAAAPLSYVGGWADRMGLKRSTLISVAGLGAACLLAAVVQGVGSLFVALVGLRLIGPGVMSLLANNTLASWFDRRLGFANSAVQLVMAGALALVPLGTMALIAAVGWREAYAVFGVVLLAGILPLVWWVYRDDPDDVGQVRDGGWSGPTRRRSSQLAGPPPVPADDDAFDLPGAMATRSFWILVGATSVWSMIGTGLIFHLDSLLSSRGLSTRETAWATPLMATCMAVMQLAGGRLADRAAPGRLAAGALMLVSGACVTFAVGHGPALVVGYGVFGLGQGIMSLVSSTVWARFFGRVHLGRIRGTALTAAISASAAGPLVMGAAVDYLGGFEPSMWAFAIGAAAMAAVSPAATRPEVSDASSAEVEERAELSFAAA